MKDFAKSIRTNNKKVENSSKFDALESIIQEASMYAENAYRRLSSPYSATNIISDLSHCKQACDIGIKRAQEYDKERNKTGNSKVGNANKTYSGRLIDIYDNGQVVAKEGWAFGEKFSTGNFGRWIDEQIRAKEKVLQECKQMKKEFESNYL